MEAEGEFSVTLFKENETILISNKFQAVILNRKEVNGLRKLIIENNEIQVTNSIKSLDVTIDNQLKFNKHISRLLSKASMQLYAVRKKHARKRSNY